MGFLKSLLGLGGDDDAAKNDDNKSKEFDVLKIGRASCRERV